MNECGLIADLFVTLIGTFGGAGLAFWIDRHQLEVRAKTAYADTLNSIRADLANLGSICRLVASKIETSQVRTNLLPIEALVLEAALINPAFLERVPHGLRTCLIVLATSRRGIHNIMSHSTLPPPQELKAMIEQLCSGIDYIQQILDEDVRALGKPVVKTPRDSKIIAGYHAALGGKPKAD